MIEGVVNAAREAVVTLPLQGPAGQAREIKAVVDTGYSGFLTLPTALVTDLGLPFAHAGRAFLANDDEVSFDVHDSTVLWDGQSRHIKADAMGAFSSSVSRSIDKCVHRDSLLGLRESRT